MISNIEKEFNNIHILVVDDYFINREIMNDMLSLMGCHVTLAESGSQALSLYDEDKFDIIFMDVKMPSPDGYEVTKQIRELQQKDNIQNPTPIIAITANALENDKEVCLSHGMNDYVAKPIKSHQLSEMIKKWYCTEGA
tara:strand:- start:431 stop:847 length:417 start_codon:yes stop_codon:yes gene_type:complete